MITFIFLLAGLFASIVGVVMSGLSYKTGNLQKDKQAMYNYIVFTVILAIATIIQLLEIIK